MYKFTPERENYEMYASGGVFYALPGHTSFPVRLSVEMFRRSVALRHSIDTRPLVLYDPCCGGAYHLATLAFFDWHKIARIVAADINADAVALATRNLSLLSVDGLDRRIVEITDMYRQYGKESHATFLQHAETLRQRLISLSSNHSIETHVFQADATDNLPALWAGKKADIVVTDIPYGWHVNWHPDTQALAQGTAPIQRALQTLLPLLATQAVVAVAANKQDRIQHEAFKRLARMQVGKRQVVFLRPIA